MVTKVTEGDEKQNKNKRPAIVMEFGVSIHSGVDKFHLWDLEEKDALFEELSMAMKKAKRLMIFPSGKIKHMSRKIVECQKKRRW